MSTVDLQRPLSHTLSGWHSRPLSPKTTTGNGSFEMSTAAWGVMLACSVTAFITSAYLAWSAMTLSPVAGCSGGSVFDCEHVLHSRWSKVLSVPVSIPALLTHATVISLLLVNPVCTRLRQLRWGVIGLASVAAGGAAVWFIGLQVFALGHLCPYCLVAHAAGLILAGTFLWNHPVDRKAFRWIGAGGVGALAVLITLQATSEPPVTYQTIEYNSVPASIESGTDAGADADGTFFAPPASVSTSTAIHENFAQLGLSDLGIGSAAKFASVIINPASLLYGEVSAAPQESFKTVQVLGRVKLSTKDWPVVGNPDADIVFVEMFDYTCPHCQQTHKSLDAAREKFGERLAVIALPVPLDGKCNPTVRSTHASHSEACEIAKLSVAVWMVDRQKFAEFHDYLFESTPSYTDALNHASSLVDKAKLTDVLSGSVPSEYIQRHVQLYQQAGSGKIPKLLFSRTTTVGAVDSAQAMIDLINRNR